MPFGDELSKHIVKKLSIESGIKVNDLLDLLRNKKPINIGLASKLAKPLGTTTEYIMEMNNSHTSGYMSKKYSRRRNRHLKETIGRR